MHLFRVGLFTLIYMASLMALAILCPSQPMILSFPQMLCGQCCFGAQKWVMVPSNVVYTFLQKFEMIPLYNHPHSQCCHT